jgi:3-methyladenine DNA glycosylase AlkD
MADEPVDVESVVAELKRLASRRTRDGMARYAIPSDHAYGVTMKDMKAYAKTLGRNHPLACALWDTGVYEARMLTSMLADPARVTAAQMDRWVRDTMCFNLFDRTPHRWDKVTQWAGKPGEFQKRTAFALLWSLTVHDKAAADAKFVAGLSLIEREADDDRNFVKKAVNMALRAIGKRNRALHGAALTTAKRLAAAKIPSASWIGKDALRELRTRKPRE